MAAKSTKPSQKSKATDINLIPFHKLKDLFGEKKPSDEEKTIENETYSALNKISKVIDNALFPMFSFEPQNDIRKISNVTSKKDKNKERKRENQQNSLKEWFNIEHGNKIRLLQPCIVPSVFIW